MPCRDYYDDHPEEYYGDRLKDKDAEIRQLKMQISFAESALCAALKVIALNAVPGADPLDYIDLVDAGIVKKELKAWWVRHQALDRKHRKQQAKREAAERKAAQKKADQERLAKEATSKLTPEQLSALLLVTGAKTPKAKS